MDSKRVIRAVMFGFSAFILGIFAAAPLITSVQSSSAQATLDAYPLDLSMAGQHRHTLKNVPEEGAPSVDLNVTEDSLMPGHFHVNIQTENFVFAPQNASSEFVPGQGHAHIFVDDVKISRAYGSWYHLPRLEPGKHNITVSLNTNDHKEYATEGQRITDSVTVQVAENTTMNMNGSDSMPMN